MSQNSSSYEAALRGTDRLNAIPLFSRESRELAAVAIARAFRSAAYAMDWGRPVTIQPSTADQSARMRRNRCARQTGHRVEPGDQLCRCGARWRAP